MPADRSTDPADVSDDVARGGSDGSGSAQSGDQHPAKAAGRRRSRRGRRRKRNPDLHPEGPARAAADSAAAVEDRPTPHRPSPADLAPPSVRKQPAGVTQKGAAQKGAAQKGAAQKKASTGPHHNATANGGAAKNGSGKNGSGKSSVNPTKNGAGSTKNAEPGGANAARPALPGGTPKPAATQGKGVRVSAPKPSDMAVRNTNVTKAGLSQDAAATTAKTPSRSRRRAPRRPERTERLRTVRETSAGGLVISDLDLPVDELAAALIGRVDRRGRMMWSLPKGHIETGETAEQTAVREVAEETGIQGTVLAPLGKIDYWFVSEGRRIHKTVHHYLLRSIGGELSDEDYEVSEVAWVPLHELPRRLTYSDERRLARMARGVIADLTADPQRLAQSEADSSSRTEPNAYERAAAARNQRRNEPPPPPARARRRRRRPRRPAAGDG